MGLFASGKQLYETLEKDRNLTPPPHTLFGFNIAEESYSYEKANNKATIWRNVFLIIGCLTGVIYMLNEGKEKLPVIGNKVKTDSSEKKVTAWDEEKPFEPETPNYEVAEKDS